MKNTVNVLLILLLFQLSEPYTGNTRVINRYQDKIKAIHMKMEKTISFEALKQNEEFRTIFSNPTKNLISAKQSLSLSALSSQEMKIIVYSMGGLPLEDYLSFTEFLIELHLKDTISFEVLDVAFTKEPGNDVYFEHIIGRDRVLDVYSQFLTLQERNKKSQIIKRKKQSPFKKSNNHKLQEVYDMLCQVNLEAIYYMHFEELETSQTFQIIYSNPEKYYDKIIRILPSQEVHRDEKRIAIFSMLNLKTDLYLKFAEELIMLFEAKKISIEHLTYGIIGFKKNSPLMINHNDHRAREVFRRIMKLKEKEKEKENIEYLNNLQLFVRFILNNNALP